MANINTALTNIGAMSSIKNSQSFAAKGNDALARLTSGSELTKASNKSSDAAIASQLLDIISVQNQANTNASNAASLIQTTVGGVNQIRDLLIKMDTLAAKANSGDLDVSSRAKVNTEFEQFFQQIDTIAQRTRWNNASLLNGGAGAVTTAAAVAAPDAIGLIAPAESSFANTLNTASKGFISGGAQSASVVANGAAYDATVVIGDQTFTAKNETPAGGGTLKLISTTNNKNVIVLDYAGNISGITNATSFQTTLREALGLNAGGNPASFQSIATAANGGFEAATAGSSTEPGTYALTYVVDSNIMVLTDSTGKTFTKDVVSDGGTAQSLIFDNGFTVTTDGTFAVGTAINQMIFEVTQAAQKSLSFQVGEKSTDILTINIGGAGTNVLGLTGIDVSTQENAAKASTLIQAALQTTNTLYSQLGAQQNRLELTQENLTATAQNLTSAKSNYSDTDIAKALADYTLASTMSQLGQIGLTKSLQENQQILQLARSA
jgi:flagellin